MEVYVLLMWGLVCRRRGRPVGAYLHTACRHFQFKTSQVDAGHRLSHIWVCTYMRLEDLGEDVVGLPVSVLVPPVHLRRSMVGGSSASCRVGLSDDRRSIRRRGPSPITQPQTTL